MLRAHNLAKSITGLRLQLHILHLYWPFRGRLALVLYVLLHRTSAAWALKSHPFYRPPGRSNHALFIVRLGCDWWLPCHTFIRIDINFMNVEFLLSYNCLISCIWASWHSCLAVWCSRCCLHWTAAAGQFCGLLGHPWPSHPHRHQLHDCGVLAFLQPPYLLQQSGCDACLAKDSGFLKFYGYLRRRLRRGDSFSTRRCMLGLRMPRDAAAAVLHGSTL